MSPGAIDLRGDSAAQPTTEMRDAMRDARIGGYGEGEDPTIAELEELCAAIFGKDASIFLPSVTMANLIACLHYAASGDQVMVDADAHLYRSELGGFARVAGLMPCVVPRANGCPNADAVADAVSRVHARSTPIRLLWVENTHNVGGGAVVTPAELTRLRSDVADRPIAIHVDGARIWNAAVALRVPAAALAVDADSVSVGFTKGLACPAGSVLVGDRALIGRARMLRKMLGGNLQKAGIVAAACIVALRTMIDRLADDHELARRLANIIAETPGLGLEAPVVTNIIRFDTASLGSAEQVVAALAEQGVLALAAGQSVVRIVTHRGVSLAELDRLRDAFQAVSAALLREAPWRIPA